MNEALERAYEYWTKVKANGVTADDLPEMTAMIEMLFTLALAQRGTPNADTRILPYDS